MYHYLFTNDLRVSNLENILQVVGRQVLTNSVPSASEDKSGNNNAKTLSFYFNLTQTSNCAKASSEGKIRPVVLNFIKKFQYPNPRTNESLNDSMEDGITLAPMRVVIQILYFMNMICPNEAWLSREEILDFVFYNSDAAKTKTPNILCLIKDIQNYRKTGQYPATIDLDINNRVWNQEERQIREMTKILKWSGCVYEDNNNNLHIQNHGLSSENKAIIFDILNCTDYWIPDMNASYDENKISYENYMDISQQLSSEDYLTNNGVKSVVDYEAIRQKWMQMDNQRFVLSCLEFMKSHRLLTKSTLDTLQNKEQCALLFKHNSLNGILLKANSELSDDEQRKDTSGNSRYYSEKYAINENEYFVSSEWRPDREDARNPFIDWVFAMLQVIKYSTGYQSEFPRNRILFGAPGTGKSFTLNQERKTLLSEGGEYERVTFHPDYSYANFVGTYKPVPCKDSDGKDAITYSYVPGPFMRTYVKALRNSRTDSPKPFLLVIEEINRANVAAVFGDVFQLLDRGDDEVSEYPIQASEDMKKYLSEELGGNPDDYAEIRIPDNMFIWATMNSADQGVFPMDTAFKRRWDFTYLGIDDSESGIVGKKVILGQGNYRRIVEWNALRKAINNELLSYKVNEDKLMGPYFISKKNLPEGDIIDPSAFTRIFKNKVIMYLFDDAAKQKRIALFGGCDEKAKNQYSKICKEFDTKGVYIFCEEISNQFIDSVPKDDEE